MKPISSVREFSGENKDKPIQELISDVPIQGKKYVLKYLKSFEPDCAAGMSLIDEITGKAVGTGVGPMSRFSTS